MSPSPHRPVDLGTTGADAVNPPRQVGPRWDRHQALDMLTRWPMGELMRQAHLARKKRLPDDRVSFVFDTNPNYTNICVSNCDFCAFYKRPGDEEGYTLSADDLAARVKQAADRGATTVLLQGGHNPAIGLSQWRQYIRAIRRVCPAVHIHPYSPAEYVFMAKREKMPLRAVLEAIWDEGITTIPGGGAEILCDSVRRQVARHKATADEWLEASRLAHEIGFRTTATMMFGHVETDADIITHLLLLRELQDRTAGFTSFIPWSFKPGHSKLARLVRQPAHPAKYVRVIATARLVLDNFPHIQSSWFSESIPAGQLGLLAGADDFGGVLVEEHVLQQAGHHRSTTAENVLTIIRRSGFAPVQRDSHYRILKVFDPPQESAVY
jgi:cyclic dehypoxanthinyl futalosine synthase